MIHEMYGCQCMILKEIKIIFVSVIACSIVGNLINTSTWRKRNKKVLINKKWKETFTYWKFKDTSLSCFKHQINIIVALLFYAVEVSSTSNQYFKLIEYWQNCSSFLQNLNISLKVYFKWNPGHDGRSTAVALEVTTHWRFPMIELV